MLLLTTYPDFLARVDELGFMALSHLQPGFPSLSAETSPDSWHTGDAESDPWLWKDRAAEEKRLAYGCILGGSKGFVSARFYPYFYAACHPARPMPDRWFAGEINHTLWEVYQLFESKTLLNTADVRLEMCVTPKKGGTRVDDCLQRLQRDYYLTVAGCRKKISRAGQPYGWPASVYDRVQHWAPPGWLDGAAAINPAAARETILDRALEMNPRLERAPLAAILFPAV